MAPTQPSIQAILRQLELRIEAGHSRSTHTNESESGGGVNKEDEVVPLSTTTTTTTTLLEAHGKMADYDDRTLHVPPHMSFAALAEKHVLPCHPFFNRLVRLAHAVPARMCVRDDNTGVEATHLQLLTDALAFRRRIWQILGGHVQKALVQRQEVYVAILAPGGYEFTVAMVAALALGAAVVPMTTALPPEEALYFVTKSRAAVLLVSDGALRLGLSVEKLVKNRDPHSPFVCIPVAPSLRNMPLKPAEIIVSSDAYLDDNAAGVVIFTSGTTGPPKVRVHA